MRTRSAWKGALFGLLMIGLFGGVPRVHACDACNLVFDDEIRSSRAGTLLARDLEQAAANQRGMPLEGYGSPLFAQANTGEPTVATDAVAGGTSSRPATDRPGSNAAEPVPGEPPNGIPDYMDSAAFPEVVARDYGLDVPVTSYVPQDTPPDKSFTITLHEGRTYIGNGVVYDGFLVNGQVPGPTMMVDEGDIVELTVVNEGTVPHGTSIHAAYTQTSKYLGKIQAGQQKSLRFRAGHPGVFLYHCAPGGHAIPLHVLAGQYGMIVVRPKAEQAYQLEKDIGHEPNVELYLIQHELYASGKDAIEGTASYTLFNGRLFRYVEDPISVRPGDYVRMYFLNVGPNLLSTFHIVGIIWDYVYWQGHPDAMWPGGQTVTAGPSDSWVIEFRIPPDEGAYTMLSHAVGSTSRGAIGLLVAEADVERPARIPAEGPSFTAAEMEENVAQATRIVAPFKVGTHPVDEPVVYGPEIEEVRISIIGNSYWPKVVQVEPGTTITWVNEDVFTYLAGEYAGIHNAAATAIPDGASSFVSPLLAHGEEYSHEMKVEGDYHYICTPHPYMEGRIIVNARAPEMEEEPEEAGLAFGWMAAVGVSLVLSVLALIRGRSSQ